MKFFCTQLLSILLLLSTALSALAQDIIVISSGAFYSTMESLVPLYEQQGKHKVILLSGSSMGDSPTSIPNRMKRGEKADLIILARGALDKLCAQGMAQAQSTRDLVQSKIGMAVRSGTRKPDISTREAFEKVLMQAPSVGYSASASGVFLVEKGFRNLGEERYKEVMGKSQKVVTDRVATWVARGDVAIGLQQVSEILPIQGADFVGTLPDPYQKATMFSVAAAANSLQPEAAQDLMRFLTSEAVRPVMEKHGLEPVVHNAE